MDGRMMQGEAAAQRLPVSMELSGQAMKIARWMGLVGIVQSVGALGGLVLFALGLVNATRLWGRPEALLLALSSALLLASCLMIFRQALLLQSAAEHFKEVSADPEEAHDHLVIAFERLKPVFVFEVVALALFGVNNAVVAVLGG